MRREAVNPISQSDAVWRRGLWKVLRSSGFPGGSDGKESTFIEGDLSSIPELVRSPGEENGYPLQHSCLENSKDRGAWGTTVHGVAKSQN